MISRIEKQLKRRFAIGSQVSEHSIVQDFTKQVSVRKFFNFFFLKRGTEMLFPNHVKLVKHLRLVQHIT